MLISNPEMVKNDWLDLLETENDIKVKRKIMEEMEKIKSCFPGICELDGGSVSDSIMNSYLTKIETIFIYFITLIQYKIHLNKIELLDIFKETYHLIAGPGLNHESYHVPKQTELWYDLICYIYIISALCLKYEDYSTIKNLIRVDLKFNKTYSKGYWFRHAITMNARAHQNRQERENLILSASNYIKESIELNGEFQNDHDIIINALCGFDLIQCLITLFDNKGELACYPSFGQFHNYRLNDILSEIINNKGAYNAISELSNKDIAIGLMKLDEYAANTFRSYSGWKKNGWSEEVKIFIEQNQ